jgi:hypothetical protein
VGDALLERLAPDIAARARALDQDASEQEEIRAEIRSRIVECAASYREFDASGAPVFDYLEQHPSYIVQHAAIQAYTRLRRERREGFGTIRIDADREDEDGRSRQFELADPVAVDPLERLVGSELQDSIGARLDGITAKVFLMLASGLERIEIARALSLDRRRIHEHVAKIRVAATAALLERDAGSALALGPADDRFPYLVAHGDARLGGEPTHPLTGLSVDDVAPHDEATTDIADRHRSSATSKLERVSRRKRLKLVEEHAEGVADQTTLRRLAA